MNLSTLLVILISLLSNVASSNDFKCSSSNGKIRIQSPAAYISLQNEDVYTNLRGSYRIAHIINGNKRANLFFSEFDLKISTEDVTVYHKEKESLLADIARDLKIKESALFDIKNDNRVLSQNGSFEDQLLNSLRSVIVRAEATSEKTYKDPYGSLILEQKYGPLPVVSLKPIEVKDLNTNNTIMRLDLNPKANTVRSTTRTYYESGYGDGKIIFNALLTFPALDINTVRVTCTHNWSWI